MFLGCPPKTVRFMLSAIELNKTTSHPLAIKYETIHLKKTKGGIVPKCMYAATIPSAIIIFYIHLFVYKLSFLQQYYIKSILF